jgi:hypothetical protein
MFSKAVLGTDKKNLKLNWWQYWIEHCYMTGWQSIHEAFLIWRDLMTDNFSNYSLLRTIEDPFEECRDWFWGSLGEDNTYPKFFLEDLMQMAHDVETGKVKTIPADQVFKELEDLFEDLKSEEKEDEV